MRHDNAQWAGTGAKWISMTGCQDEANLYLQFARRFTCDGRGPLVLDITAVTQYQAAVNGQVIGRGPAVSSPALYYFHRYILSADELRAGENLLTVLTFHDGRYTTTVQGFDYGEPGLLVHLYGASARVVSDAAWRVRRAPEYAPRASMVSQWGASRKSIVADAT